MKKCPLCEGTGYVIRKGDSKKSQDRIAEILRLRSQGLSLREISAVVGIAPNTALYHIRRLEANIL